MVNDLLCEVVYIDYDMVATVVLQTVDDDVNQWLSPNAYQGFGGVVCERSQSCSETCGKEHGLHMYIIKLRLVNKFWVLHVCAVAWHFRD